MLDGAKGTCEPHAGAMLGATTRFDSGDSMIDATKSERRAVAMRGRFSMIEEGRLG